MTHHKTVQRKWGWGFALVGLGLFLYLVNGVLLPFIVALILSYVLNPVVEKLENLGLSRILSSLLVVLALFVAIGVFLFGAIPFLKDQLLSLISEFPEYTQRVYEFFLPHLNKLHEWEDFALLQSKLSNYLGDMVSWGVKMIVSMLTGGFALANLLSLIVITPLLVFYLLRDWRFFLKNIEDNLPRSSHQTILILLKDINLSLGGYIRGQTIVSLSLSFIYTIGLVLVGLHYAVTLGVISGLLAFIPYVGFIVSFSVALSLALAQYQDFFHMGLVIGVYAMGQVLEASFLTPKFVGDRIGVHPVWIIFSLLVSGTLLGFWGVLFSLPIAATAGVLVRFFMKTYRDSLYYQEEK